jgi:hypothetical protein
MWSFCSVSRSRPLVRRVKLTGRLVKSCGLHRIPSTVFSPAPTPNPFLRNRPYLLTPPEDALELGERIHTLYVLCSFCPCSSSFPCSLHLRFYSILSALNNHRLTESAPRLLESNTRFFPHSIFSIVSELFSMLPLLATDADWLAGPYFPSIGVHQH